MSLGVPCSSDGGEGLVIDRILAFPSVHSKYTSVYRGWVNDWRHIRKPSATREWGHSAETLYHMSPTPHSSPQGCKRRQRDGGSIFARRLPDLRGSTGSCHLSENTTTFGLSGLLLQSLRRIRCLWRGSSWRGSPRVCFESTGGLPSDEIKKWCSTRVGGIYWRVCQTAHIMLPSPGPADSMQDLDLDDVSKSVITGVDALG